MIPASDTYKNALRHSHESVIRVTAYEGATEVGQLNVASVDLSLDGTALVQRSADILVGVDPLKTESREVLESITTTKGSVVIEHAISYGGLPVTPFVKIATLRVDEMEWVLGNSTRLLRCYDRSLLLQEHFLPTPRPLNDTYTNLISELVAETLPGETVAIESGINTTKTPAEGKSFGRGDDRLSKIQELAEAVDAWLVCEPDGSFALKYAPGTSAAQGQAVQWDFNTGEGGVLVGATNTFSRRHVYNAVGVEFTPAEDAGDWSGYIFAWDNDSNSPTYYDGEFGKRVIFFTEEYDHLPSATEAEAVARRKLYEHSGQTRAIRVTGVYNPLLLPGDKVTVDVPSPMGGFVSETHYIERLSMSLGTSAAMDVETRLARLPGSYGITVNGVVP